MSEKIVCVDLDGVLAKLDKWEGVEKFGPVIPGARFFLEELRREGFKIVIHTVRCSPDVNPKPEDWTIRNPWDLPDAPGSGTDASVWADYLVTLVRRWLNANDLTFDEIWYGRGKPLADIYIDDRAVGCRPLSDDDEEFNKSATFKNVVLEAYRIAHHPPACFWSDAQNEKGSDQ